MCSLLVGIKRDMYLLTSLPFTFEALKQKPNEASAKERGSKETRYLCEGENEIPSSFLLHRGHLREKLDF